MNLWQTCLEALTEVWPSIKYLIGTVWSRPEDIKSNSMNQEPITPPITIAPNPDILVVWDTKENCRHNVRVIADFEGLTLNQKNFLSMTVHCESNYNPKCVHPNVVNGKTTSTDYGIAQINDFYHIGPGKDFPSVDFVLNNPEACMRWMARNFKNGHASLWVCASKGLYTQYSA